MNYVRIALFFLGSVCIGIALGVLITLKFHVVHASAPLPPHAETLLELAGVKALASSDVPVAAGVWYGDSLLGIATNTVRAHLEAGGHAEINAISDAMRRVGPDVFGTLSRDSLLLVTTFEPCGMCRGAIAEYDIRRVIFIREKPLVYRLRRELWREWTYYVRRRVATSGVQDRLFQAAVATSAP